jgi:hypothetical protein
MLQGHLGNMKSNKFEIHVDLFACLEHDNCKTTFSTKYCINTNAYLKFHCCKSSV